MARGRFYNAVDLVNRLETETRNGRQGRLAEHLTRMDFIVLDELGYLRTHLRHCHYQSCVWRMAERSGMPK
jgi:DNA replication protein DnaC